MKTTLIFFCAILFCMQVAHARVIDVSDHGVVPGEDASFKLNQLIESVKNEEGITLVFPKAQYDFYPENAQATYRYVANHDNGLKRMAFPLFNSKNITIDGGGSVFMFHGRLVPFTIESVNGATLKNFSIDWIRPFHAELTIVERNEQEKSFVVEIDPELYPYSIKSGSILFDRFNQQDPIGSNIVFDPETRSPIFNTSLYKVNGASSKVTSVGENLIKFESFGKGSPPPVGSVLVVYGVHPTSRLVPAIHVTNSKDLKIEDVTVYDAGGMALIVERTENIHLNRFKVTSGEGRMVATRADATHFIGCRGTITLENSTLEHMLDDGINVHGAYVNVDEYLGNNQFICSISHFQQMGLIFAEPGDRIAILSRETVLPFFETKIKDMKRLNEKRFVLTLEDTPAEMPEVPMSMENLTWNPDVLMRNNKIRENRARSALITTKGKVVIENNYFNSQMHGILIEGDNKFWYESGAVQDVTIKNNTFVNSGFGGGAVYPLYASPMFTPEQRMGEGQYHRNINFVNNKLISFNGHMVFSRSVQGLNISGNTIERSEDYPISTDHPAINLNYSDEVRIENNRAIGFKQALRIKKSEDSGNIKTEKNKGFSN